jgi:hypothetical protein
MKKHEWNGLMVESSEADYDGMKKSEWIGLMVESSEVACCD